MFLVLLRVHLDKARRLYNGGRMRNRNKQDDIREHVCCVSSSFL